MSWFKSLGSAMVKHGFKALSGVVPFGEVLLDVAKDIWAKYSKSGEPGKPANIADDLQAAAAAPAADVQREIAQAVEEVAADQPPEVKKALTEYLDLVPYAIRRSFRRPSDASGTTAPASLWLQQPRDLVTMLPPSFPRFKAGDRPLPGVPWVLEELLGKGGFGEVWLACHPRDNSLRTALKFCLDEKAATSLRHEAKALARVRSEGKHAGIVELRQVWDENEPLCLEYEYIEGGDLSGLIREKHASGPPSPDAVARWMLHLLEPIRFVHGLTPPIVHRDLKPSNILVERLKGGRFRLRVADFGISDVAAGEALRDAAGQALMLTNGVGGFTALYASPQQINNAPANPQDDVHALGVIWLQMLTGDLTKGRPSGGGWKEDLRERGMGEQMLELLENCMDDKPAKRPRNAGDLADNLTPLLGTKRPKDQDRAPETGGTIPGGSTSVEQVRREHQQAEQASTQGRKALTLEETVQVFSQALQRQKEQEEARALSLSTEDFAKRAEAHRLKDEYVEAITNATEAIRLSPNQAAAYCTRARGYLKTGEVDKAMADSTEAIRLNPKDATGFFTRAGVYILKGELDNAMVDATEGIRVNPKEAWGYRIRAGVYLWKEEFDRAIANASEVILLEPNDADAYSLRGESYRRKGEYDRAIADASEAIRLNPKATEDAFATRAMVYREMGDFDKAIADASEMIRLNTVEAWGCSRYAIRADVYRLKGEYGRAIADATEAIRLNPKDAELYWIRAESSRGQGEYDRAIADSTEAIRLDPKNAFAYATRAESYWRKGEHVPAISDATEAIRLNSNCSAFAYCIAAEACLRGGEYDSAIIAACAAIRLKPMEGYAYRLRAVAHAGKKDYDKVISDATEAIRLIPKDAPAHGIRAEAYLYSGKYDKAIFDATEAIRLEPTGTRLYWIRAEAYLQGGENDKAIADASEAIRLKPNGAANYSLRAAVFSRTGEYDKAIADATEAIRLDPKTANAYRTRGAMYLWKKAYEKAAADLTEAIRLDPDDSWARTQLERVRRREV